MWLTLDSDSLRALWVLSVVALRFDLTLEEMRSEAKRKPLPLARAVAGHLLARLGMRRAEIARQLYMTVPGLGLALQARPLESVMPEVAELETKIGLLRGVSTFNGLVMQAAPG